MHILLCGERQVGKSTLIRRLLQENRLPVYGFMTRMERTEPSYPVYIHPAGEPMETGYMAGKIWWGPVTAAAGNCIWKYSTVWGQD